MCALSYIEPGNAGFSSVYFCKKNKQTNNEFDRKSPDLSFDCTLVKKNNTECRAKKKKRTNHFYVATSK